VLERLGGIGGAVDSPGFVRIVVADAGDAGVVGVVRSGAGSGDGFELFCVIDERLRKRGCGSGACRLAIAEFRAAGAAERLLASVAPGNADAIELVTRLRFKLLPERRFNGDLLYALAL